MLFLPTTLASCEIGSDDPGTAVSGEGAEGNPDPDPAEAGAKQHGSVSRACEPLTDHPLNGQSRGPGEVFAEDGTARTLGKRSAGHRAVREVLATQHVRGVTAGGAEKTNVHSQGGETMASPHGIHPLEERGLRAGQGPGLSSGCRPQEGETCQKSYENLLFDQHSRQSAVGHQGRHPPKGVDRVRSERLFQRAV